jgi:hypothetical protein
MACRWYCGKRWGGWYADVAECLPALRVLVTAGNVLYPIIDEAMSHIGQGIVVEGT